ncbi:MAG: dTDP-4-dehydrorhamnose reductase [Patescibacteria group bacterium]|jgi:dTDP-4-dehydrorhamnose reductase
MRILILGGQGNLGTQLTKVFEEDYEVISWDKDELNVLDFAMLTEKINELAPSLIINAVAYNAVDKCEDKAEYEIALKLNQELPGVLADLARKLKAVLIHYSTDYVFNGTEDKKEFLESDTPNPINKYGESKFLGEREVLKRAARGLDYYLIRTSKLFGPRGTSPQAKPSFFDIMLDLAQTKKELTVVNEELSCFTYTPDLAAATKRLWEIEAPFGIYHLINEGPCTWHEAASELFRLKKIAVALRPVRSENLLRAARRPKYSVLKNLKIKKLRNWQEALREYLASVK